MSTPSARERRARAVAEAAAWAQRLDAADLSETERGEFVDWLRESPVHVAEMLRMGRLFSALGDFGGWSELPTTEHATSDTVVRLDARRAPTLSARIQRGPRRARIAAVAAVFALFLFGAGWAYRQFSDIHLYTHDGERREVTLDDGSVLRLSPRTDVRVKMEANLRSIALKEGEAVFRVAKDPLRPFVVNAARARVQAVGTVFAVARHADTVVVTVSEGRVSVLPIAEETRRSAGEVTLLPIALQANERISISSAGVTGGVRRVESARVPQWDDTALVFENLRVAEVVSRFNRRNRVQIRIVDEALAARTVSGVFDADDPQSFVAFLITIAGAKSIDRGPDEIVVTAGSASAASTAPAH